MGMSQTPTPAEGFVSIISYDPTFAQLNGATLHHHHQAAAVNQAAFVQHNLSQYNAAIPVQPSHPVAATAIAIQQPSQPQQPTLLLLASPGGDSNSMGVVAATPNQLAKSSSVLVVNTLTTDLNQSPQHHSIIQLPTNQVIQVPMPIQQVPSESITLLATTGDLGPQHGQQLNLVMPGTLPQQPNAVNFAGATVQMPANTVLINSNVFLCLQPSDEGTAYQLTASDGTLTAATLNCTTPDGTTAVIDLVDDTINQTITAKGWYADAEVANRALSALTRHQQT